MQILKFGGTSLNNAERILNVRDIILERSKETSVAVVVSAMGGITDFLLNSIQQMAQKCCTQKPSRRLRMQKFHYGLETA